MTDANQLRIERRIARSRIVLSIAAPLTVYLDPTQPIATPLGQLAGAAFFIDPHALAVLLAHLAYSVAIYVAVARSRVGLDRIAAVSMGVDVVFGVAVAIVTEGTNSPFYVFFLFAVLATGLRGALRATWTVTIASVSLYLGLIVLVEPEGQSFYLVRAVYLALTGMLAGSLGFQRRTLASNLEGLTRSLREGYAQTLAGVTLHAQACRMLVRTNRKEDALTELTNLLTAVTQEYDKLRALMELLGRDDPSPRRVGSPTNAVYAVRADFEAPFEIVEQALQIMLEGARNVAQHAGARSSRIKAHGQERRIVITIDDDGVGFPPDAPPPISIASRAAEVGGAIRMHAPDETGGHLQISLPGS